MLSMNHEPVQYFYVETKPTPSILSYKPQVAFPRAALLARFDHEALRLWVNPNPQHKTRNSQTQ